MDCFPPPPTSSWATPSPASPARSQQHNPKEHAVTEPSTSSTRDAVIGRYSSLARTALAGGAIADCDRDAFAGGRFGAAAYPAAESVPEAALRASLGCGNPLAVADLHPGETVLDLGSGGGLDVLLSARRVGPGGIAYGLDASPDMLALARAAAPPSPSSTTVTCCWRPASPPSASPAHTRPGLACTRRSSRRPSQPPGTPSGHSAGQDRAQAARGEGDAYRAGGRGHDDRPDHRRDGERDGDGYGGVEHGDAGASGGRGACG